MTEFGEKLKEARQKKGLTQQTLADRLYVTRQAVSRWECGARYPDLLTAKKIAQILDVTIDELLSEEQLRENIEREPLLARPTENWLQTCLYTAVTLSYLLLAIFNVYSLFPSNALAHTPAGQIHFEGIVTVTGMFPAFLVLFIGLVLSAKNQLSAKFTGCIMCMPYLGTAVRFLVNYVFMRVRQGSGMPFRGWVTDFCLPLGIGVYIVLYFYLEERRLPCAVIFLICVLSGLTVFWILKHVLFRTTDLGFAVMTVHAVGKAGMTVLLAYQAYIWDCKKKVAYK